MTREKAKLRLGLLGWGVQRVKMGWAELYTWAESLISVGILFFFKYRVSGISGTGVQYPNYP